MKLASVVALVGLAACRVRHYVPPSLEGTPDEELALVTFGLFDWNYMSKLEFDGVQPVETLGSPRRCICLAPGLHDVSISFPAGIRPGLSGLYSGEVLVQAGRYKLTDLARALEDARPGHVAVMLSPESEDAAWEFARAAGPAALAEFLEVFSESPRPGRREEALATIWDAARSTNTRAAFERLLSLDPPEDYRTRAEEAVAELRRLEAEEARRAEAARENWEANRENWEANKERYYADQVAELEAWAQAPRTREEFRDSWSFTTDKFFGIVGLSGDSREITYFLGHKVPLSASWQRTGLRMMESRERLALQGDHHVEAPTGNVNIVMAAISFELSDGKLIRFGRE